MSAGRAGRGAGVVIRGILLSLLFAFALGIGIGTWLRCAMEAPTGYLAGAAPSAASPLPLDVGPIRAAVGDARQDEEKI